MMKKTNAARLLDRLDIHYSLRTYPIQDGEHLEATTVAQLVGMEPAHVFKTLAARGDKHGVLLACIPADQELDLKKLAEASDNKRVELIHLKEVLSATGYVRGGVSPLGVKKDYPVYVDDSALALPEMAVSAGMRGAQLILAPQDLIRAVRAVPKSLVRSTVLSANDETQMFLERRTEYDQN